MDRTKIIAVANYKGGVSKTTTVASLGSILSDKGYKVLIVATQSLKPSVARPNSFRLSLSAKVWTWFQHHLPLPWQMSVSVPLWHVRAC